MNLYLNAETNTEPTWNKRDYLLRAARRLGFDWVIPWRGEPDVECILNIEPFEKFITGTRWTGIWEIDLALDRGQMTTSNWVTADDVFIAISTIPGRLKDLEPKTRFLPQASDIEVHRRIEKISQEYDFVFSGSMGLDIYRERERVQNLMREHFSFRDYGKAHAPQKYIEDLNTARVQFIRSGNTPICPSWTAQRFYECLPIGPVLTDWTVDLDKTGLVEGLDYFSYKNDTEMLEKMHNLIDNPELANDMASRGRMKSLMYHTYEHRLISILNVIKEHDIPITGSP